MITHPLSYPILTASLKVLYPNNPACSPSSLAAKIGKREKEREEREAPMPSTDTEIGA